MWLGSKPSISLLHAFVTGYSHGRDSQDDHNLLDVFNQWICTHYDHPEGAMGWSDHLLRHAGDDEERAFELFFTHLDSYISERASLGADRIHVRFVEKICGKRAQAEVPQTHNPAIEASCE